MTSTHIPVAEMPESTAPASFPAGTPKRRVDLSTIPTVAWAPLNEYEAAAVTGHSVKTLRRLRQEGSGPRFTKLNGCTVRYKLGDLWAYLDAQPKGGGATAGETKRGVMAGVVQKDAGVGALACRRCGLDGEGEHTAPGDRQCRGCGCIDRLRAMVADLEFRIERMARKAAKQPTQKVERRGGRRDRSDTRFVVLDGQRLCLADAARALGVTTSTLHFRLVNRVQDKNYQEVDVRAVGADVAKHRGDPARDDDTVSPAAA
jgi:hypothetical protein